MKNKIKGAREEREKGASMNSDRSSASTRREAIKAVENAAMMIPIDDPELFRFARNMLANPSATVDAARKLGMATRKGRDREAMQAPQESTDGKDGSDEEEAAPPLPPGEGVTPLV